MKQPHFLHFDTNSQKLKVDWKVFDGAWSKMSVANVVSGLQNWLYLKKEEMELTDFLHAGTISQKLKGDWKCLGWTWSEVGVASVVMEF